MTPLFLRQVSRLRCVGSGPGKRDPMRVVLGITWMVGFLGVTAKARAQDLTDAPEVAAPSAPAPNFTPAMPSSGPPPFSTQTPYPIAAAVEATFQPDDPNLRLLSLSGEMPYQEIAVVHRGWWRPRGYFIGYGLLPMYAPLCDGPCNLRLMRGQYHWALSKEGGPIVPVEGTAIISGPSALHAHFVDHSDLRTAGAIVGIVGAIGGIIMIFESFHEKEVCDAYGYCYRHDDVNGALLAGGLGVFVGSAIASSIMIFQRDEAKISVSPLRTRPIGGPRESGLMRANPRVNPPGAAVTISF